MDQVERGERMAVTSENKDNDMNWGVRVMKNKISVIRALELVGKSGRKGRDLLQAQF